MKYENTLVADVFSYLCRNLLSWPGEKKAQGDHIHVLRYLIGGAKTDPDCVQ